MPKPWIEHTDEVLKLQEKGKKAIEKNDYETIKDVMEKLYEIEQKQKAEYFESKQHED